MSRLVRDLGTGLRKLRRHPGVPFVAWMSLTLAIAAAATIFSVVNSALLKPFPYPAADRLVYLWEVDPNHLNPISSPTAFDRWQQADSLEMIAGLSPTSFSLTANAIPENPFSRRVTLSYFPMFGVEPILGRLFSEEEAATDARVVILSRSLWQRQFDGDPSIIGREIELDYEPWKVIGVIDFRSPVEPAPVEMWVPMTIDSSERRGHAVAVWGRLAAGVTVDQARQELTDLIEDSQTTSGRGAEVRGLREWTAGLFRTPLLALFAAGILLLLIVFGNATHLLVVRVRRWQTELAVRGSLGAERSELRRQLLGESVLVALAAAAAALVLTWVNLHWLRTTAPLRLNLPQLDQVTIDGWVVLFVLIVAVGTALLWALVPARLASPQRSLAADLKLGDAHATPARRRHLLRDALVILNLALALALLIGTGLMVQTCIHLQRQFVGRDPDQVLTLRVSVRGRDYLDPAARIAFFRQAQEAVAAVPGVEAVGATDLFPLIYPRAATQFVIAGRSATDPGSEQVLLQAVTPTYLEMLGVSLPEGRPFADRDTTQGPGVVIVNRRFVSRYLGEGSPLGQHLVLSALSEEPREIVGVVSDLRSYGRPAEPVPAIYVPYAQLPTPSLTLLVRTAGDPQSFIPAVHEAIAAIDRLPSVYQPRTLTAKRAEADWSSRCTMVLLGLFALVALIQAVSGIHAVVTAGAAERRRELAIRVAGGARVGQLWAMVMGRALVLAATGIAAGAGAALILAPRIERLLFEVTPRDPLTYLAVSLLLVVLVLAAAWLPAQRVMREEPAAVLRQD